jgi:hypothetical protein
MAQQATIDPFRNFDEPAAFKDSQERNLRDLTRNFVVEFGADEARIAFDLSADEVRNLLKENLSSKCSVRWM